MTVTDHQMATLQAYLTGNFDEHDRLHAQLRKDVDGAGYGAVIAAAFFESVDRRFANERTTSADVTDYVSDVRSRSEEIGANMDPIVAERLIRHSLGDGSIVDIDSEAVVGTQFSLMVALVVDQQLSEAELDEFLAEVRRIANRLLE